MQYLISFFEGIITFISPCLLPMLPIYVSYFAAGQADARSGKTLKNALGFVLGFTLVFFVLGLFFGTLGSFLRGHSTILNILFGAVVILFGLSFMGVIKPFFGNGGVASANVKNLGFFKSVLFGLIFSVSWTPCIGTFLGSALALASTSGSTLKGALMLLCYSAGLGIPFVLSALLIDKLKKAFDFIKRNYKVINFICGLFLVLVGTLMMTGLLARFLNLINS